MLRLLCELNESLDLEAAHVSVLVMTLFVLHGLPLLYCICMVCSFVMSFVD
jgi:hypothetical protein